MKIKSRFRGGITVLKGLIMTVLVVGLLASGPSLNWNIQTVVSAGEIGLYTSIALDSHDVPHISYYDDDNKDLKYARWKTKGWEIVTIDAVGDVGMWSSIALDKYDNVYISYVDATNTRIKMARYQGAWDLETVDDEEIHPESTTSIAVDRAGTPHISYMGISPDGGGILRHAQWTGSAWTIGTVDKIPGSSLGVGLYCSIAIGYSFHIWNVHISYYDRENNHLKHAVKSFPFGMSWIINTVDSAENVGLVSSIAVDSSNQAHISYGDSTNKDLKYAYGAGTSWTITTVEAPINCGFWNSIALDSYGRPHISYNEGDPNFDLKYAKWNGSIWEIQTVDSAGQVGQYTSIALDSKDRPHISYHDWGNGDLKYAAPLFDDILGTWTTGVWYHDSMTEYWNELTESADLVTAGDVDRDGIADLIGVWNQGEADDGFWVMYSSSGDWAKIWSSFPIDITSGDMNGDGRDDIISTWTSGVWYTDGLSGAWYRMVNEPAILVAAGDVDGDGIDDLIGVWSQGKADDGLWMKSSLYNAWRLITAILPIDIASGDMNGDGRDDILGSWEIGNPPGVFYLDSISNSWVKIWHTPASLVAAGDVDGDGTDDFIGVWDNGLSVKYSSTGVWHNISKSPPYSLPMDIDAGIFRGGAWPDGGMSFEGPVVGYAEGPGSGDYIDLTDKAPGGKDFVYREDNLIPREEGLKTMRVPGPGEPGFKYIKQKDLIPEEKKEKKK